VKIGMDDGSGRKVVCKIWVGYWCNEWVWPG